MHPNSRGHFILYGLSGVLIAGHPSSLDGRAGGQKKVYEEIWFIVLMVLFVVVIVLLIVGFVFIYRRHRKSESATGWGWGSL